MKLKLFFSVVFLTFSAAVFAQSVDTEKLNSYFKTLNDHDKFMGTVAISKNGKMIYQNAFGYSNVETSQQASIHTKYKIGSVSKTFTAVLVFKAIEQKKLSLETQLGVFYPSIKNADKITIKHLLNHSSGIYSFTDDADYLAWNTQKITEADILTKIKVGESNFEPGTKNGYSNSNYVLLSMILEKVFKQPYEKILHTYIVKPLGLKNTYMGESKTADAKSYMYKGSWKLEPETHYTVPLGAGAIVSTATDLVTFINALFDGRIINQNSLKEMTSFNNTYGAGLFEMPYEGHLGIGHDGAIDGFRSMLTIFPEDKISYAVISNASDYKLSLVTETILTAVFKNEVDIPDFKEINFTEAELEELAGTYASTQLPFKLTVSQKDLKLFAQATGQAALPLEAVAKNIFTFDKAGIKLTFDSAKKTVTLAQSGRAFELTKE